MSVTYFSHFPKLELHAHLNGSLSEETLRKLRIIGDDCLDESWPADDDAFHNLSSCFNIFQIAHRLTKTSDAVKLATACTIKEFADDGVIYLELRSTPRREHEMMKSQYLQAMVDAVLETEKTDRRICVTILVSINRGEPLESAKENVDLALEFANLYPKIVVGVDFSGNPSKGSFSDFIPVLEKARTGSLYITLHCAEEQNDSEVLQMLEFCPDRIGHFTQPSLEAVEKLTRLKIPVELCVTSNLKCSTVPELKLHHFGNYYTDHPVILGTDDKGVFRTSLSEEYALVQSAFAVPDKFFWEMNEKAVDFCFAPTETKSKLRDTLNKKKKIIMEEKR